MRADWLFLLTDVDALYTSNPITDRGAQPIHTVHDIGQLQVIFLTALSEVRKWFSLALAEELIE